MVFMRAVLRTRISSFPLLFVLVLCLTAAEAANNVGNAEKLAEKDKKNEKGKDKSVTKNTPGVIGQTSRILDKAQCLNAIDQCRIINILESELKSAWERTTLKNRLKAAREQRKDDLKRLKKYVILLLDYTINNPNADISVQFGGLCDPAGLKKGQSSPAVATTTMDPWIMPPRTVDPLPGAPNPSASPLPGAPNPSTSDPWTKPSNLSPGSLNGRCRVSEWTEWSQPYGFGQQDRVRVVLQAGPACPESERLKEERNITSPTDDQGEHVTDNVDTVTTNFHQDFVKPLEGRPRDLLVVLDSSGSISDSEFQAMQEGLVYLIDSLCGGFGPKPNQHHLAIVQFSTHALTVHSFKDDQNPDALKAAVKSARPLYGVTCTGEALGLAFDEFDPSKGVRAYAAHDTLVITDGQSNCQEDIYQVAHNLQNRTKVYALAVGLTGNPAATAEVTSLVTDNRARHLFSLTNFFNFRDMVSNVKARQDQTTCQPIA